MIGKHMLPLLASRNTFALKTFAISLFGTEQLFPNRHPSFRICFRVKNFTSQLLVAAPRRWSFTLSERLPGALQLQAGQTA